MARSARSRAFQKRRFPDVRPPDERDRQTFAQYAAAPHRCEQSPHLREHCFDPFLSRGAYSSSPTSSLKSMVTSIAANIPIRSCRIPVIAPESPTVQLTSGLTPRGLRTRPDDIGDGFGLRKIEFAVQKGTLRELPRSRQSRPGVQRQSKHAFRRRPPAMTR